MSEIYKKTESYQLKIGAIIRTITEVEQEITKMKGIKGFMSKHPQKFNEMCEQFKNAKEALNNSLGCLWDIEDASK